LSLDHNKSENVYSVFHIFKVHSSLIFSSSLALMIHLLQIQSIVAKLITLQTPHCSVKNYVSFYLAFY